MENILTNALTFLALLNPFALYIYLIPIQRQLRLRQFTITMIKASLIAGSIYVGSAFFGQQFFEDVLQIDFESFRVFGGLVLILFAVSYIVQGRESLITMRGSLNDLAGEIALPFMVGAGTISLSILIGSSSTISETVMTIGLVMFVNLAIVLSFAFLRYNSHKVRFRNRLSYNSELLLRINGFILGAFGVDMVMQGIRTLFF